jgi:hypothetical protein
MAGPHSSPGLSLADKLKKYPPDIAFVNKVARISEPERMDPETKTPPPASPSPAAAPQEAAAAHAAAEPSAKHEPKAPKKEKQEVKTDIPFKEFKSSYYTSYEIEDDIDNILQRLRRESRERGEKVRYSKKTIIHEGLREIFKRHGVSDAHINDYLNGGNNG